jgi:signal transduction histidine kinase
MDKNCVHIDLKGIETSVLGHIMAAQNIIFVLPHSKSIADFFSKSLSSIPGIHSCRVCIGGNISQEDNFNSDVCNGCDIFLKQKEDNVTVSKELICKLGQLPNYYAITLETIDYRFGYFIFHIDQIEIFNLYKPFINNLGNFVALSLENRIHRSELQKAQDILENRVKARNQELLIVNSNLKAEIQERKLAEEEIHKLNLELEQRVVARTTQLEAANKELEAFAYSVSHDLRAPLRHIDGFLELLFEQTAGTLDEKSKLFMKDISDASKRMGNLIDDLLSFSRMGRHEMISQHILLKTLIDGVIQELSPDMLGRNIQWNITDLPEVIGDRSLLHAVMVNLISNAIKFTRHRDLAEIKIGYLKQNLETIIYVSDNGVGFDMKYADKLFGVFQRLHRTEEFEGTGIGLANVRRIIERHGGRTWAEGKINEGATFYFSLLS